MSPVRITGGLLEKLGEPASVELLEVLNAQQEASTEAAMTHCAERFERRLVEETSKIRVEMAQLRSDLRAEVGGVRSDLRAEIGDLRSEMRQGFADVRREMVADRFELLKWAFAFWVGQLVGVAGIVGLLLRTIPAR